MSPWQEIAAVIGMMAVTFGVRYPVLALSGRVKMPALLLEALRFVPVAVLSAIVLPMVLAPEGQLSFSVDNEYLLAGIFCIAVAAFSRHLLLTIILGMGLFLLLRFVF
ncbi:MAG: AzlD domain-containing protein [Granulosicoccus sp.]